MFQASTVPYLRQLRKGADSDSMPLALISGGRCFETILNALSRPHAFPASTIASPDDSVVLRGGDLDSVGQLHHLTNSASVRNHNRGAALDFPSHHQCRQAPRIGRKPIPMVPEDRGTPHLLRAVEHSKARGRIENLLLRNHLRVNRPVVGFNTRTGMDSAPAWSIRGRLAAHLSAQHGRAFEDVRSGRSSVSRPLVASTSRAAFRSRPYRDR